MTQSRFRSPVLWAAVTAQILSLLVTLQVIDTGLSDAINGVIASALQLLVAFGVLNNPTSNSTF